MTIYLVIPLPNNTVYTLYTYGSGQPYKRMLPGVHIEGKRTKQRDATVVPSGISKHG
jgi:hypothetical protein